MIARLTLLQNRVANRKTRRPVKFESGRRFLARLASRRAQRRIAVLTALLLGGCLSFSTMRVSANTEDDVINGQTDLTLAGTYSGGLPTTTSDVTFTSTAYSPAAFTLGSALSIGTLNDLGTTALTISGSGPLTLNGGSNSVAAANGGSAADLLYVITGGSLSITNTPLVLTTAAASGNFDIAGTAALGGVISGTGFGFTKTGAGTLTLSGANTYTGGTIVNAGTLQATGSGTFGNNVAASTVNIGSAGTVLLGSNVDGFAYNTTFSGSGLLLVNPTGGSNIKFGNFGAFTGTIELATPTAAGSKWNLSNSINIPSATLKIDNGAQFFPNAGTATFGTITVIGTGNNENLGAIRLNTATVQGNILLLGNASVGPEGGTLAGTISSGVAGTQTLTFGNNNSGGNATINSTLSDGSGVLALRLYNDTVVNGSSSYTGGTNIYNGTTKIGSATAFGTGVVNVGKNNNGGGNVVFDLNGQTIANATNFVTNFSSTTLTNSNTTTTAGITGNVVIQSFAINGAGSINLGNVSATGFNNNALSMNGTGTLTLGGTTDNAFLVVNANSGTVVLNKASTNGAHAANQLQVAGGTARFGANTSTGGANGQINGLTLNSGTVDLNGASGTNATIGQLVGTGGTITNTSATAATVTVTNGTNTFAGIIQDGVGTVALTNAGATETLSGANTFSGATTFTGGTLNLSNQLALQNSTLNFTGGTFVFDQTVTGNAFTIGALGGNQNLALSNNAGTPAGIALTAGGNNASTTYSGALGGLGSLNKTGSGTLTLTQTNTFAGGLTISNGVLSTPTNTALGGANGTDGAVSLNGGTLNFTNANPLTQTHAITVGASGGKISETGTAANGQNSRVVLNSANLLLGSGNLTISGNGTLGGAGATGTTNGGAGALVLNQANNGAGGFSGNLTLQAGGLIEYGNANALLGTATVTLGNEGEFALNGLTLPNAVTVSGSTNSVLSFNGGNGTFSGNVTDNGNLTIGLRAWYNYGTAQSGTISGPITGSGSVSTTGGGTVALTATNTFSGGLNVNSGTVVVGNNTNPTNNTGTGLITLNGGTLQLQGQGGAAVTFYTSNAITFNGGTLFANDGVQHVGENAAGTVFNTITVGAGGGTLITQYSSKDIFLDGVLTGSGGLTLQDTHDPFSNTTVTHVTNAANTYSGTITINEAAGDGVQLSIDKNAALTAATITASGNNGNIASTVIFAAGVNAPVVGAISGPGNITLADQAGTPAAVTLTTGGNNATTAFTGILSGAGGLTKAGTGTMTLSAANTYTGATSVTGGTLTLGLANTLATTSRVTVGGGARLSLAATNALATPAATTGTLNNPVALAATAAVPITLGGGTLLRNGAGVNLGSQSGTNGTVGAGMLTLTAASTLDFGTTGVGTLNFNSFADAGNAFLLTVTDYTRTTAGTGAGVDGTDDRLIFNQNMSGFLVDFSFNGQAPTQVALGNGEYELVFTTVPEPSTWAAGVLCLGVMGFALRRRTVGRRGASL